MKLPRVHPAVNGREKTTLWLDKKKLARAQKLLGTTSIVDTVDGALSEVLAIAARGRLVQRLRAQETDIGNEKIMATAWR